MDKEQKTAARTADAGAEKKPEKKPGLLGRILTTLLLLAAVLAMLAVAAMQDGGHLAQLRRWLMYGDTGRTQNLYVYSSHPGNLFGQLGERLLVVSPNALRLLADDGSTIYDLSVNMGSPGLTVGGELAAVCDVGGSALYVLDEHGIRRTLSAAPGLCFYTARMNGLDQLAVTEQKNGYKAAVSVYDKEGELLFQLDSYDNYISDALVTEDGERLVTVALTPVDGVFASVLRVYDLASGELTGEWAVRDGLILDYRVSIDRLAALCDNRLTITTMGGEKLLDHSYGNLYLHDYTLGGEDFCALLLGRYQAGNICRLTVYDLEGAEVASREVTEEVLDISAAGPYLAVLYSDELVIYHRDLTELARLEDTDYAGHVQMDADGTALVMAGSFAWRFLP